MLPLLSRSEYSVKNKKEFIKNVLILLCQMIFANCCHMNSHHHINYCIMHANLERHLSSLGIVCTRIMETWCTKNVLIKIVRKYAQKPEFLEIEIRHLRSTPTFNCSKLTKETLEQCVKSVQS